jgi:hypothetical protein
LLSTGTKFLNAQTWETTTGAANGAIADFNGDGKADILWRNTDTGSNAIWLSGSKSTQQAVRAVTDTSFNVEAVGDFNGDHKADIFWVNAATGETSLWLSANINTKAPSGTVRDMSWSVVD